MRTLRKLLLIDFDDLRVSSRNSSSPFFQLKYPHQFILKPDVPVAFELLLTLEIPYYLLTCQPGLGDKTLDPENFATMWSDFRRRVLPEKYQHFYDKMTERLLVEPTSRSKRELFRIARGKESNLKRRESVFISSSFATGFQAMRAGFRWKNSKSLYRSLLSLSDLQG